MDPSGSVFGWIVVLVLIIFSFISSITETAIVLSSKIKLQNALEQGNKKAKLALQLKERQSKVLASCLVANNIANLAVSSLVAVLVTRQYSEAFVGIATGILTFVIMIFSEVTPKNIATKYPESVLMKFATFLNIEVVVLSPIAAIVNGTSNVILKIFKIDMQKDIESFTEEEIKTIVDISHEEGIIETEEKEIIHNVFEFDELMVKDIMVPRADMVFVNVDASYDELMNIYKTELYTRLPVYEESQDNIIGIINIKDLVLHDTSNKADFKIKKIMRPAFFVYENRKVADVLKEMRRNTQSFSIVLDEYGATSGLLTMEDILEEIVGDIRDEYDKDEEEAIKKVSNNEYVIEGSVKIDDINEKLDIHIVKCDDFDSIGGMVLAKLDHIPEVNDEVDYDNFHLKVLEMDNNRIALVKLTVNEPVDENKEM